jgi:hypothetical protein
MRKNQVVEKVIIMSFGENEFERERNNTEKKKILQLIGLE